MERIVVELPPDCVDMLGAGDGPNVVLRKHEKIVDETQVYLSILLDIGYLSAIAFFEGFSCCAVSKAVDVQGIGDGFGIVLGVDE